MSCPHSSAPGTTPDRCSLCLGIKPRVVRIITNRATTIVDDAKFDISDTVLTIDGVDSGRSTAIQAESRSRGRGRPRRGIERRCGICGRQDHTRTQCSERGDA